MHTRSVLTVIALTAWAWLPLHAEEVAAPVVHQPADWTETLPKVTPVAPADIPGRYASAEGRLSMVLPPAWRGEDVRVRELHGDDARTIQANAEAAVIVEYVPKRGEPQALLTVFRMPLAHWRMLEKESRGDFGRLTFTTYDTAYIVHRPDDRKARGRYAKLRILTEEAIGTLAFYDAVAEKMAAQLPQEERHYFGKTARGADIELHLEPGGVLRMRIGKDAPMLNGQWIQRGSELLAQVVLEQSQPRMPISMRFDGDALEIVSWDIKTYGVPGAPLTPRP